MFDTHETLDITPRPERTEQEIAESNALLNRLYDFDRGEAELAGDSKVDLAGHEDSFAQREAETDEPVDGLDVAPARRTDIRAVEGALDADTRGALGDTRSERQRELREVVVDKTSGDSPLTRAHDADVRQGTTQVNAVVERLGGATVTEATLEARKIAEDIESVNDGEVPTENGHQTTQDVNETRRAAIASEVLGEVADGNVEVLNRLDDGTAQRVIAYEQSTAEQGGADRRSNDELAYLGQKIEQGVASENSGETVNYVGEDGQIHQVEKSNHAREIAGAWLQGNWNAGKDVNHATRDKVFYYLETVRERENVNDPEVRQTVLSEIAQTIAIGAHDSDREVGI